MHLFWINSNIVLLLLLFSVLGLHHFIDFSTRNITFSVAIPLLIGSAGVFLNFLVGEIDRKKLVKTKSDRPYKFSFMFSVGVMIFAIVLGGVLNPAAVFTTLNVLPFIAAVGVVFVLVALGVLIFSTRGYSADGKKEPLIV